MIENPWDKNALHRHQQILSGKDISFDKVLVPQIENLINSEEKETPFTILEVGCGTGILLNILSKDHRIVVGIDSSRMSIEIAKEYNINRKNITAIFSSVEEFVPNNDTAFDFIVANMVFQAIPDAFTAFKKVCLLLKPECPLILTIPHPCFWGIYKELDKRLDYCYHLNQEYSVPFTITNDNDALPVNIPYFHRPISWYFNALSESGLFIEKLIEPCPSQDIMDLYQTPWSYPHFLIILARTSRKEY